PANSSWPGPAREEAAAANRTLQLRALVYRLNFDQPVRREARWRPGEAAVALVVQVHERAEHLRLLLASLRRAPGAEKVLLVLSHDVWSAELNALAASVDFCAVLQVFFPFSLQLYPGEFPGTDPRDCPRDVGPAAARRLGCLNAQYPDAFGHYREAAFAQTKHHWWWKLHFVWERVRALREHPGLVLFLEEDHYLAPDFLRVLQHLWALRQRDCPECQVLSLGGYAPVRGGMAGRADKVELKTWKSTEHNMGMAFARDTYRQLIACTDAFCTYDDYNWDWTLQHLTVACLPRFWKVLVPEIPRVFHTGDCGMHHKKSCQPSAQSAKIDSLLSSNQQHLFPESMTISKRYSVAPLSPHVKNGGWGDIRDHELCKSYRGLQ
ncbi:alpha-1,6-mannosyl-glycoprotein 2-beta-N-acetylglucosaminyltransferase, partial [Varanus komodoensis]|uniref:alpha-1,6-mannosyl-glycoprotein 2-beta-N-acetylglucosaminyltransferase n=1 Tax=Varanus komodoensis TaxID=61221 RepID=UPI001CF7D83D